MTGVKFVIRRVYGKSTLPTKMTNKARKEWDLGVQPSSYKASINFTEYPIESGQGIKMIF